MQDEIRQGDVTLRRQSRSSTGSTVAGVKMLGELLGFELVDPAIGSPDAAPSDAWRGGVNLS